jgi:hypothetical protein
MYHLMLHNAKEKKVKQSLVKAYIIMIIIDQSSDID